MRQLGSTRLTIDGIALEASPPYRRLQEGLQDLIISAYETSTKRPGKSLSLRRLELVSGANNEEKCYLHYRVLVREAGHVETTILNLMFIAGDGENTSDYAFGPAIDGES